MADLSELGPFEIREGATGDVYRGCHRMTGTDASLKVIRPGFELDRPSPFEREIPSHARLVPPGVVDLFEYGHIDEPVRTASNRSRIRP